MIKYGIVAFALLSATKMISPGSKYSASIIRSEKEVYFPVTNSQANNLIVGSSVSVGYAEGRYYTVTEEKQRQLTSKMAMYNLYSQQSLEYPLLKWNDVGNVCEDWTVEELTKLAMEIDAYVTPLVERQQSYEKTIQKAKTIEEVENITLSFE